MPLLHVGGSRVCLICCVSLLPLACVQVLVDEGPLDKLDQLKDILAAAKTPNPRKLCVVSSVARNGDELRMVWQQQCG